MKVKLIKNRLDNLINKKLINYDLSELPINEFYFVFAINIHEEGIYFYIYSDYYLFPAPSQMFEIISNDIPPQWKVIMQDDTLFIGPDLFYEPFFFDRFSNHDEYLIEKFRLLSNEMYPDFVYKKW
jgi:hypothetical protein